MKKFISILAVIILIIAAVGAFIGYRLISSTSTYTSDNATRTEKAVAWLREGRSIIRGQIEQNQTGSIFNILNVVYNLATKQTQALIDKTEKSAYTIEVQTNDMIISYTIQIPNIIQNWIQTESPDIGVTNLEVGTTSQTEMLAGIVATTSGDRQIQEKEWLNIEKIASSGDIVIAYTRALGVSFSGAELEMFGDMVHAIEEGILSGTITKIEKINYTMAYIEDITANTWSTSLKIDPIQRFDGTWADEAFAKYDPTTCAASLSWTNGTKCTTPNGYFIYDQDTGDTVTLTEIDGKLELIDTNSQEWDTYAGDWVSFIKEFPNKYTNIPFHIYYNTNKEIIQITEQYIP